MALTLYFASTFNSAIYNISPNPPSELPDGLITYTTLFRSALIGSVIVIQLSQGLYTNVPYDGGFGDFCCNNRFCYRARSEPKEMKRRQKGLLKGINIEVDPIKWYRSNMFIHSYYHIDHASINNTSVSVSVENISSSKIL